MSRRALNLILITDGSDHVPIETALQSLQPPPKVIRVSDTHALSGALADPCDAVLIDHRVASLPLPDALRLVRERDRLLPVIVVSAPVGEESVVAFLKAGVTDFVLDTNLSRLGDAVLHETASVEARRVPPMSFAAIDDGSDISFEQTAVGMIMTSLDGRYLRVNRRFCELVGYSGEELLGMTYQQITHPDDLRSDMIRRAAIESYAEASHRAEKRYIRKNGETTWAAVTVSLRRDIQTGQPIFLGVVEDIAAQKEAEQALRSRVSAYTMVLDQASDAIFISDRARRFVEVNTKACELSGFSRDELLGMVIGDLVLSVDDVRTPQFDELLEGRSLVAERRLRRKAGEPLDVEVSARMLDDGRLYSSLRDISERKRAEAELRLSERRFEMVTLATSDGVYDWDIPVGKCWFSHTFYSLFGYRPTPEIERAAWWLMKVHPDDVELVGADIQAAIDGTDEVWSCEYRFLTAAGTYANVVDRGYILRDSQRRAVRMIGTMMDVTARKAAENALRASEARFRRLYESNMLGVTFWQTDGRVLDANDAYLQMIGYTREDLRRGRINWREITPPEMRARDDEADQEMAATGVCTTYEKEYQRKDGSRVTVLVGGALLENHSDIGVAFFADISSRREAEEAVRMNEERFRAMIENNSEVITVVDGEATIHYQSPSVAQVFGYEPEELLGTSAYDLIHPDDRARIQLDFEETTRRRGISPRVEFRYRHKDGSWRWVETIGNNLLGHPAVMGIVITMRDVTERKLFQSQLDQAERLSSLGRLAATIAHEFNNVLMGIQPFAEVIRRVAANDALLTDASHHIVNAVQRGKRITQDILRFTQPAQPTLGPIAVKKWLRDTELELRGLASPLCQLVVVPLEHDLSVSGDAFQLNQVFANLVLNARDAMPAGGQITITADEPSGAIIYPFGFVPEAGNYVHISVHDTGTGIPRENLGRIFEPLFTTKRNGTGLGLAVAHQVIERHHGHLFVESTYGEGTTFHLFIPRHDQVRPSSDRRRAGEAEVPVRRRILLVEDDVAVAEGTATLLGMADFDVRIASTGMAAVPAADEFKPDVVILDVGLPDISGLEVYERLREKMPRLPVIFSTAHGDRRTIETLAGGSPVEFLQKPYEFDALAATVERLLQKVART